MTKTVSGLMSRHQATTDFMLVCVQKPFYKKRVNSFACIVVSNIDFAVFPFERFNEFQFVSTF